MDTDAGEGLIEVTDRIPTRPIREPLTEDMFAPLQPHEKKVLLWTELDSQHLQRVVDLMRPHPEVGLSVLYDAKDLDFLELFPWLKTFETGAGFYTLESIDGLRHLTQLEELDFPATKKRFPLNILEHFPNLTRLGLDHLDSKTPDLDSVGACVGLRKLGLRSCKFDNLDFLQGLPELYWLALNGGSCADLSPITTLPSLSGLVLYQVKVPDITPITQCVQLKHLDLESVSTVTELPDLSNLNSLKSASLKNLKNLTDISPLLTAHELTRVEIGFLNIDPDEFSILNEHSNLKYIWVSGKSLKWRNAVFSAAKTLQPDPQGEFLRELFS
ncbi:leucine-rich repeat domain-containing protein [Mycobacteroides abscessus]|uniref:leucine-rich repeat domain-containing protein n=1 Tax=Mycobacteroides abscessus TaxID=36809 RepID=UPI0009A5FB32|nr:hypothetical protein [Mycobacteroides abscessus]